MIERMLSGLINHLLGDAGWARDRLRPFAGQAMALRGPGLAALWQVTVEGMLAPTEAEASVTIVLPDNALALLLTDRAALFAGARLNGPADFCEALAFVFRNLRWDAEADLARVFGDILARRLHAGLLSGLRRQADVARRAGANLAEFVRDEQSLLLTRSRFTDHVAANRDLAQRLQALAQRLDKRISPENHG